VVFNSRYAEYVDVATNEFIRAIGFGDALINGELDFQLVKQTIEWKAPARFDQVLSIAVAAKHQGTTSYSLTAEFRIADTDANHRDGRHDLRAGRRAHVDEGAAVDSFREALKQGAPGHVTDHAGYGDPLEHAEK